MRFLKAQPLTLFILVGILSTSVWFQCHQKVYKGEAPEGTPIGVLVLVQQEDGLLVELDPYFKHQIIGFLEEKGFSVQWISSLVFKEKIRSSYATPERISFLKNYTVGESPYGLLIEALVTEEFYTDTSKGWAYKLKTRSSFIRFQDDFVHPYRESKERVYLMSKHSYANEVFRFYMDEIQQIIFQFVEDEFYSPEEGDSSQEIKKSA